ncbi:MAG: HD domain-containing protein [Planctomycetaceae bacterium]|jgi:3'-5' exoribonuclease|nr:HD domain-containing protein [Planctomycetaceae bacterium]
MRRYINQLKENEKVTEVFMISDKQLRPNKNGNLYLQFNLSDKTGLISGRIWNITDAAHYDFENGDYVHAEGTTQRFNGVIQFIGKSLVKVEAGSIDPTEFVRFQTIDIPKAQTRLREILRTIAEPSLRNLADCFMIDDRFVDHFSKAPAGIKLHHAYPGGLLEHSLQMMETALRIADLYPVLNRDLLVIGAFLHDIGKIKELGYANEMFYTDQGQLLGHPFLGVEILYEKIAEAEKLAGEPFDAELMMLLKHMLISHHGTYENQSSKLPMTLEAVTLHFIDSIDSKIAEFRKYMLDDPNTGNVWTNYIPGIDRKLYKGKLTAVN